MKKITLFVFCLLLLGCTDDLIDKEVDNLELRATSESQGLVIGKGEWESWKEIKLSSQPIPVYVPWNAAYSTSNIPDNIRKDILAEDGWILLRNAIKENKPNMNYLIFYNQFTGILKGFYYLENSTSGNNGYWRVSFDSGNQKLLYNQDGFFTYPYNISPKIIPGVNIMNVTRNPTKGFTIGWNCFQVELAYDPNQPQLTLNIDAYQQNVSTISIKGTYQSQSSGSIISSTSTSTSGANIFGKSAITAIADSAKSWILSNISVNGSNRPIKNVAANTIASIANGDMKTLVNMGANILFGSFLGGANNAATNYTLQFKTSGDVTLIGQSQNPQTTSIPPVQIQLGVNEKLGIWNLEKAPIIEIENYAVAEGLINSSFHVKIKKEFKYNELNILVNEKIKPYIRYTKDAIPSSGYLDGEIYNPTSVTRARLSIPDGNDVYRAYPDVLYFDKVLFNDGKTEIVTKSTVGMPIYDHKYWIDTKNVPPKWADNATGRPAIYLEEYYINNKLKMPTEDIKIVFHYFIKINGVEKEFNSIRTYDPEYRVLNTGKTSVRPYGWTWKNITF